MSKRFTFASVAFPIGLALTYGSASELLALPDIVQIGCVVLGIALMIVGAMAACAHWADGKNNKIARWYLRE